MSIDVSIFSLEPEQIRETAGGNETLHVVQEGLL
jgi:hypothetical protein